MKHLISPSILSADFANLERDVRMINESEADWIHCDIMDGNFVPNISFGLPVLKAVSRVAEKPLDVHLMIEKPERYVEDFRDAGAEILTVHYEACTHLDRVLHQIKDAGMMAGVSLNPGTPVSSIADVIEIADMVLIMSVNPGFGGQKFIQNAYKKVQEVRDLDRFCNTQTLIEVDGGVNAETGRKLIQAGADVLVAGSYVFKSENPQTTISRLKNIEAEVSSA